MARVNHLTPPNHIPHNHPSLRRKTRHFRKPCGVRTLHTTHDENSTTVPTDDEDRRSWSAFTTATEPSGDELLTLPPHCSHWLDIELSKQLRELEKDVAALLVDEHRRTTHHDDIIELTSLPRDQWIGYFTPL